MDRLNLDETRVTELRADMESNYPGYGTPCPGSVLKIDDDVLWLEGIFPMRVLWGHDHPDFFNGYCPEYFGDLTVNVEGHLVTDRAPADPNETPMPIYPETQQRRGQQQQQPQHGKHKHDATKALHHLLKQLDPPHAKKVRALVKAKRPELLDKDG